MITLKDIRNVYFIGIGGIGMSALARYFHEKGALVSGYDRTPSSLTEQLESEGISIHYKEDLKSAPSQPDAVIYTPAISANNKELNFYREKDFPVLKRSEVLGMISKDMFCIAVGGTHGKTTTSTLIAHILRESGYGCNAFLGGISLNYNTNFWSNKNPVAVIEADEYDRSFLRLKPDIAVLTAMDADHLDIYGTEEAMQDAYILYTRRIKENGTLIYKLGLHRSDEMGGSLKITYNLKNGLADSYAKNIKEQKGKYSFSIIHHSWVLDATLNIGGMHNVENAVAAATVANVLGIAPEKIRHALSSFQGIKRRFEYIIKTDKQIYIDDYAHHPEELKTLILSAKDLFPEKQCTVIFQPHLYSRTRDMAASFAEILGLADEIILLPVYAAREEPLPGVESELIANKIKSKNVQVLNKDETLIWLKKYKPELLITAGAGDIGSMVNHIKKCLMA